MDFRSRMMAGQQVSKETAKPENSELEGAYMKLLQMVERMHRQLLDVIKDELERLGQDDINAIQALLIYNIGDEEFTAGELRSRGHYLGSNVSYNLKKLVEAGYICHKKSDTDKRSVKVSLTPEGHTVKESLSWLFERHLKSVEPVGDVNSSMMESTNLALERLERFWADQVRFRL